MAVEITALLFRICETKYFSCLVNEAYELESYPNNILNCILISVAEGNQGNASGRSHDHHLSPTELEEGSSEGGVDNGGRGRIDHVTHLHNTVPSTSSVESSRSQVRHYPFFSFFLTYVLVF
jgi:hypothetical protein